MKNYSGFYDKGEIKCIFFSEFDTTAGPKLTYQVPEGYVSKDVFDVISNYIIPKESLLKRVITVNAMNYKIIGHPIALPSTVKQTYKRNSFNFNLCFVCDSGARTVQYEQVVKKLSGYLVNLEIESSFLYNEETKVQLPGIMAKILRDLNENGSCSLSINDSNTIHLRVLQLAADPPVVEDYHVPVLRAHKNNFIQNQWDLTTQQIWPYIDGFNHVARISHEADVESNMVKACIQNMMYYEVVNVIPIFQYSNVYTPTPEIQKLAQDVSEQEKCVKYVARTLDQLPRFKDVFTLYCELTPGTTVRDLCTRHNPQQLKIDERKLIQWGVMEGYIRRLHKYPIQIAPDTRGSKKQREIAKLFDGLHSFDEICCRMNISSHELEERVDSDPGVVVCWK